MLNSYNINIEQPEYKEVSKGVIVCTNCYGSGKVKNHIYGDCVPLSVCEYCEGKGTLKLKKPTKELEL